MTHPNPRSWAGIVLGLLVIASVVWPTAARAQNTATLDLAMTLAAPTVSCSANIDNVDFGPLDAGSTVLSTARPTQLFNMNFSCSAPVAAATATFDIGLNPYSAGVRQLGGPNGAAHRYIIVDSPTSQLNIGPLSPITFALPSGAATVGMAARLWIGDLPTELGTYTDQVTVTFTF